MNVCESSNEPPGLSWYSIVQVPVPKAGGVAAMVKEEALHGVWSGPASAGEGGGYSVTFI